MAKMTKAQGRRRLKEIVGKAKALFMMGYISTKDLETVKQLIGQVGFFTNPTAALTRIREVRDIFDTPKQQILTQLEQFSDPKKHLTDDAYNNTMKIINEAALGASTFGGKQSFDEGEYTRDDDGNIFIDLTNMAN